MAVEAILPYSGHSRCYMCSKLATRRIRYDDWRTGQPWPGGGGDEFLCDKCCEEEYPEAMEVSKGKMTMGEPFDTWRHTANGVAIRQLAVSQVRHAYNIGFNDGAATNKKDLVDEIKRLREGLHRARDIFAPHPEKYYGREAEL
jgi:hypothetical protein